GGGGGGVEAARGAPVAGGGARGWWKPPPQADSHRVRLRRRLYPLVYAESPRRRTDSRSPASPGSSLEAQDSGRGPPEPEEIPQGSRSLRDLGGFADSSAGFAIRPCTQGDN